MAGHTDKEKSSKSMKEKPMKEKAPSKKGGNPWINHVKAQAKKLKIDYRTALKDPRVKKSYKSKK